MDDLIQAYKDIGYTRVKAVNTADGVGYYLTNSGGSGSVYLPPDATSSTAVVGMYPGMGRDYHNPQSGTGNYSDYINGTILTGNAPTGTILVIGSRYGGNTSTEVPNAVDAALGNGVPLTNVGVMTFSGSGETGMYAAGIVSNEHSDLQVRVINCDAYTHGYIQSAICAERGDPVNSTYDLAQRQRNAVNTNMGGNVLIVNYIPDKSVGYEAYGEMLDDIDYMGESGHNTMLITSNSQDHGHYRVSMLKSGAIDWLAGRGNMDTSDLVRMQRYDSATNQWIDCDINEIDGFEVKLLTTEDLYNELKERNALDLATFAGAYGTKDGENTLASNLSYVNNSMEAIRGQITEHTDVAYNKESSNEAGVIGAMYNATNYYGSITNLLYGNLKAETEAVYGIANAIFQMDGCASQIASTSLSDGISNMFATTNPEIAAQLENLRNASADLLDTTKNSIMSNDRYSQLKEVLGTTVQAGNVGKISISSLDSAVNSIIPALDEEVGKAHALNSSVTDFMSGIGASNILQGGVWEDVGKNMTNYQNLLNANEKAATFIQDSVMTAMGIIKDYIDNAASSINDMGTTDYGSLATLGELDDSKLPELTSALSEMQVKIDETDAKVREMEASRHMVEDGYYDRVSGQFVKTGEHQEPSEAEIQVFRDELANYKDIKAKLDKYKEVLDGFAPVVQAAQEIINSAIDQVTAMYANPVQDTDGNLTFNSDFNLDLNPYSDYIDTSKDYKQLINDYHAKLNEPDTTDTQTETPDNKNVGNADTSIPDSNQNTGNQNTGNQNTGNQSSGSQNGNNIQGFTGSTKPSPKANPKTEPTTQPNISNENTNQYKPEISTEIIIITEPTQDDTIVEPNNNLPNADSHVNPSGKTQISTLSAGPVEENINTTADPIVEETVLDVPETINEYTETPYVKPVVSNDQPVVNVEEPKANPSLKTMGIASGLGVAVGAAALGAHTIMKNKDDEDTEEDYGYNK